MPNRSVLWRQWTHSQKKTLIEGIMVPRMKEMFDFIGQEIEKHQLFTKIPAGVVLSGGGSDTVDIVEVCRHTLQLPTRVGIPSGFQGLIDEIEKPAFSASLGLLRYAASKAVYQAPSKQGFSMPDMKNLMELPKKIVAMIQSLMP